MAVIFLLAPSISSSLEDFTLLAPKRYDKFMGGPTEYYDMFPRCYPSDTVLLSVKNGGTEDQRITSAVIYVNGVEIMSESDFGPQVPYLERFITVQEANELRVVLKSGLLDGSDGYSTSFLEIEIAGTDCDVDPPYISDPTPFDGAIINDARPQISVNYDDDATGSGIDIYATRIIVDGVDVTEDASISNLDVSYSPGSELSEGTHEVRVAISDLAFNRTTYRWNFKTDTIPPSVKITERPYNKFINTPVISISGESNDSTATVTVNNNEAINGDGKFSFSGLQLYEGENVVLVHSRDFAGNIGEDRFVVTLDTIPPWIEITSHDDNGYFNTPVIDLSGKVNEPVPASEVNGSDVKVEDGIFTFSGLSLAEGANSISVGAVDRAGNRGTKNITINLDTIPPEVGITSQTDNVYLNTPIISITGTLNEPVSGVSINGHDALIDEGYRLDDFELTEGANTVSVTATDRAGNTGTKSIVINLDTAPPEVEITSQTENAYLNTPVISISGTLNEPVLSATVNGNAAAVTDGFYSFNGIALAEGANTIVVEATDRAGNKGSKTITVNLDTVPPLVDITSHKDGVYLNTPQIALTGTVSEPELNVSVNDLPAYLTETGYHIPALNLTEGLNKITVKATDRAGNTGTATIDINLDTIEPVVDISSHENEEYINTPLANISGTLNEPAPAVTVNGHSAATIEGAYSLDSIELTEGANNILVAASDRAGNIGTKSIIVNLDTVSPVVDITSHYDGMNLNRSVISIAGTLSEPATTVSVNGRKAKVTGNLFSLDKLDLTEGANRITVSATDRAGNTGTMSLKINLDTVLPVIDITSLADHAYLNTPIIPVSGVFNEAVLEVTVNGAKAAVMNGQYGGLYNFEGLELKEGPNSIIVEATDLAGNRGNKVLTINLDTIPPEPYIAAPKNDMITNLEVITVSGGLNETVSSVTVNGLSAEVKGHQFMLDGLTLKEGANTIDVLATDPAGNIGSASVSLSLDTVPPGAPVLNPLTTPTNAASIVISGRAEAGAAVSVFSSLNDGSKKTVGSTRAGADGTFTISGILLKEGVNSFTANAEDRAGNISGLSPSVSSALDTAAPLITVTSPHNNFSTFERTVHISGSLNEKADISINGNYVKTTGLNFNYPVTLSSQMNVVTISATDKAGNKSSVKLIVKKKEFKEKTMDSDN